MLDFSLPPLNRGEGMLILLPDPVGVEKRGCCSREAIFGLLTAGIRELGVDVLFGLNIGRMDAGDGSSSSTKTQFRRSSSFSWWAPVCRLFAAGLSGVVSGEGSFSRCCVKIGWWLSAK